MSGRTVIVTGASSGLGQVTARTLAGRGARVVLAVRNLEKGRRAAASMPGDTEVRRLELGSLASVREFAAAFEGPVDVLINNAGIMMPPLGRTEDGFESQFGTNHLGHFALTNLLLPQITGRVVTVSSNGHRGARIDFEDLNWERRPYRALAAYSRSKLANLLFTSELQRRLSEAGSPVIANAAHPGLAKTNLGHSFQGRSRLLDFFAVRGAKLFGRSEEEGASPTIYAAVADIPGDSYAGPGLLGPASGTPRLVGRSRQAQDGELARRLWQASEQLTGVTFPELRALPARER